MSNLVELRIKKEKKKKKKEIYINIYKIIIIY
jgi:hypothetical protein